MIVLPTDSVLRLVTQPDHARLAAEILALWRSGGLPEHPRRDDLLFAVREHDNGWREADAAPGVDPGSGRPHTFLTLPQRSRMAIWERGVHRFAASRPYASLLILEHARRLHRDQQADPSWEGFFRRLDELGGELGERVAAPRSQIDDDYRWLSLADRLSLTACGGIREPVEQLDLSARLVDDRLLVEPFPLAGATTFEIRCRFVPDRFYRGDADLGGELAAARWRRQRLNLRPPPGH